MKKGEIHCCTDTQKAVIKHTFIGCLHAHVRTHTHTPITQTPGGRERTPSALCKALNLALMLLLLPWLPCTHHTARSKRVLRIASSKDSSRCKRQHTHKTAHSKQVGMASSNSSSSNTVSSRKEGKQRGGIRVKRMMRVRQVSGVVIYVLDVVLRCSDLPGFDD